MSFVSIVRTGWSAVRQNTHMRSAGGFMAKGAGGIATVAGYGVGSYFGYQSYGRDYGAGAGVLIGLGEAAAVDAVIASGPIGWAAAGVAAGGYFAYQHGKDAYKRNRQLNMGRPMIDNYGTMGQMRMQSIQNLARSRSGMGRVLGNEARLLHR